MGERPFKLKNYANEVASELSSAHGLPAEVNGSEEHGFWVHVPLEDKYSPEETERIKEKISLAQHAASQRYASLLNRLNALRKAIITLAFEYPSPGSKPALSSDERRSVGVGFQLIDAYGSGQIKATFSPLKKAPRR